MRESQIPSLRKVLRSLATALGSWAEMGNAPHVDSKVWKVSFPLMGGLDWWFPIYSQQERLQLRAPKHQSIQGILMYLAASKTTRPKALQFRFLVSAKVDGVPHPWYSKRHPGGP